MRNFIMVLILFVLVGLVFGCIGPSTEKDEIEVIASTEYKVDKLMVEKIEHMKKKRNDEIPLYEIYRDLKVIDVHSHDARAPLIAYWEQYGIDRTVIFGDISEPSAVLTDKMAWDDYKAYQDNIYPSFAGIQLRKNKKGIESTEEKLERGFLNIGELVAASTYSPVANNEWKAKHPNWGNLPEIYNLAAQYQVPVLLHIDPPNGTPINLFKKALRDNPETIFIFAHGNVYNTPESLKNLLSEFDNLYVDFFAGFTRYNTGSEHSLEDFVPLIEAYPERFFLGTDSGVEVGYTESIKAMYEIIDMLSSETAVKIAFQNYERLIEQQPPTNWQIKKIKKLAKQLNITNKKYHLNKRQANELIFELEEKLEE